MGVSTSSQQLQDLPQDLAIEPSAWALSSPVLGPGDGVQTRQIIKQAPSEFPELGAWWGSSMGQPPRCLWEQRADGKCDLFRGGLPEDEWEDQQVRAPQ